MAFVIQVNAKNSELEKMNDQVVNLTKQGQYYCNTPQKLDH
jgi:hypothetical protein